MRVNLFNSQIAKEFDPDRSDVQQMTTALREGVVKKPKITIQGEVEFGEAYVVAGHKGNPLALRTKGREGRRNLLKGARSRGTLEKEKPPVFGMVQRCGQIVIEMLVM